VAEIQRRWGHYDWVHTINNAASFRGARWHGAASPGRGATATSRAQTDEFGLTLRAPVADRAEPIGGRSDVRMMVVAARRLW